MKKVVLILVIALSIGLMFAGCKSKESKPPKPGENFQAELAGAPDWVVKGCFTYWGKNAEDKICAVGSMGGTRNISMATTSAEARARAALATSLSTRVKRLYKDYQATVTGGEGYGTQASDEQYVVDVSKQLTDITIAGTERVEIWISPSGTVWAIVALNVEKFASAIQQSQNLDEKVRQYVVDHAKEAFGDLDNELEKVKEEAAE